MNTFAQGGIEIDVGLPDEPAKTNDDVEDDEKPCENRGGGEWSIGSADDDEVGNNA